MLRSSFNPAAAFDATKQESQDYSSFGDLNSNGSFSSILLDGSPNMNQLQSTKGVNAAKYTDRLSHITDSQVLSPFLNSIRPMTPSSSHFGTPQLSFAEESLSNTPMSSMANLLMERSGSPYPASASNGSRGTSTLSVNQRPQQRRLSTPGFLFSNTQDVPNANPNTPRPRSNSNSQGAYGAGLTGSPMNSAYGLPNSDFFSDQDSSNALNMFGHPGLQQDRSSSFMDLINMPSFDTPLQSQGSPYGMHSNNFGMSLDSNSTAFNGAQNASPAMNMIPMQSHVGNPVWSCVCGHTFEDWMVFQAHLQTHRAEARPHVCDHCKRGFARRQDLKRHIPTHFKPFKPFECSTCHTTFTRNDALQRHLKAARCEIKIKKMKLKLEKERAAGQKTSGKDSDSSQSSPEEKPLDTGYSESGTHQIPSPPITSSENTQQQSSFDMINSTLGMSSDFAAPATETMTTMGFPLVSLPNDTTSSQLYSLPPISQ